MCFARLASPASQASLGGRSKRTLFAFSLLWYSLIVEKTRKLNVFWLPTALWMGLIFYLSSFHKLQASPISWQDFIIRKTAHFLEYAILCILMNRGFKNTTGFSIKKRLFWSLVLTVLYALSDEFHQTKVYGRTGKAFDVGVDFMGALFGLIFSWKVISFLPEKIKKILDI